MTPLAPLAAVGPLPSEALEPSDTSDTSGTLYLWCLWSLWCLSIKCNVVLSVPITKHDKKNFLASERPHSSVFIRDLSGHRGTGFQYCRGGPCLGAASADLVAARCRPAAVAPPCDLAGLETGGLGQDSP